MNCQEIIHELSNFIDGELDGATKLELERHLMDCKECRLVVNQTKKTIEIFCDCEPIELPGEVRNRLHEALRRKLREATQ
ncbi:MAG: anti-sigma factor family protein [Candidatus Acidiferrales bacterium]